MDSILYIPSQVRQAERLLKVAPQSFLKQVGGHGFMTARQQNDPHVWIDSLQVLEDEVARRWGSQ